MKGHTSVPTNAKDEAGAVKVEKFAWQALRPGRETVHICKPSEVEAIPSNEGEVTAAIVEQVMGLSVCSIEAALHGGMTRASKEQYLIED